MTHKAVTVLQDDRLVVLRTERTAYAFTWNDPHTALRHLHWGCPVTDDDVRALVMDPQNVRVASSTMARPRSAAEELPVWGGLRREEVALKLAMPDGVRGLDLAFDGVDRTDDSVSVRLVDTHYPVEILLRYRVDAPADAIVRDLVVTNTGQEPVLVEQAFSASWPVPRRPTPQLVSLAGMYGAESRVQAVALPTGRTVLESRSGLPGHDAQPFVAVTSDADEDRGEVWSVGVAWSGSWKLTVQRTDDDNIHVVGGVNDIDLRHELPGGVSLTLPETVGIHTCDGLAGMTRRWHDHERGIVPHPERLRPVHYNSWEATYFDVTMPQQRELAHLASDLGVELFVIDDGWFAGRDDDTAGLGDWVPDATAFPDDGLRRLAEDVHGLGMQFGLWVEPEMVNEDSDLYRAHPDWTYRWPTRAPTIARHQLVLDFSRRDVQDWAIEALDTLVRDVGVDYLKWDMNRPIAEPASPAVEQGGTVWIEHVRGLWRVWHELRARFPDLWLESCASGGGRADLGAVARTHWVWPSDNTDPLERLEIQRGFSMTHLPMLMSSWVTDRAALGRRDTPLRFRFHVAMTGLLALGGDLRAWGAGERNEARDYVDLYKEVRPVVQFGDLRRLPSPDPGRTDVLSYVARDRSRAVVFVFARAVMHTAVRQLVRMRGLDVGATYDVHDTVSGEKMLRSGSFLMGHGVLVPVSGDYASTVLVLQRQASP